MCFPSVSIVDVHFWISLSGIKIVTVSFQLQKCFFRPVVHFSSPQYLVNTIHHLVCFLKFLLAESTFDGFSFEILDTVGNRFCQSHSTHDEQFFCPIWGKTLLKHFLLLQNTKTISNFEFWFYIVIIFTTIVQCAAHVLISDKYYCISLLNLGECQCISSCCLHWNISTCFAWLYDSISPQYKTFLHFQLNTTAPCSSPAGPSSTSKVLYLCLSINLERLSLLLDQSFVSNGIAHPYFLNTSIIIKIYLKPWITSWKTLHVDQISCPYYNPYQKQTLFSFWISSWMPLDAFA